MITPTHVFTEDQIPIAIAAENAHAEGHLGLYLGLLANLKASMAIKTTLLASNPATSQGTAPGEGFYGRTPTSKLDLP